jgi:hypothetical protein
MLRTCSHIVALTAMVAALSTAQADEPTTLTLACKGTQISQGDAGTTSEQINIGIIVDFQKKKIIGLSDDPDTITGLDETRISFSISSRRVVYEWHH